MDFSAPWKSRLSAAQLQAQLSRLTDRTRLRRLKDTLLSKGAWQQVTRIEDLRHAQVSHKSLYLDACAGSVLTPHDLHYQRAKKTLVQQVPGLEVASADAVVPSWTNLQHTPKPREWHHACVHAVVCGMKLADPGITTEMRGAHSFTMPAG